jgi:PadR family transcriptional regulator, regulatory protein PadR
MRSTPVSKSAGRVANLLLPGPAECLAELRGDLRVSGREGAGDLLDGRECLAPVERVVEPRPLGCRPSEPYVDWRYMRVTPATVKVLQALLSDPTAQHYGYELMRATKVKSGSLYPILERLEYAGWLESRWEKVDERQEGRPSRRYYMLTALGQRRAGRAVEEFLAQFGIKQAGAARPAWGTVS